MADPPNPPTTQMILNALTFFNEDDGTSRNQVNKFIATKYDVKVEDSVMTSSLEQLIDARRITQTRGRWLHGFFKIRMKIRRIPLHEKISASPNNQIVTVLRLKPLLK